ncbi:chalcone isomerase family protein [Pannonibacter sp. Pt2-lr]
MGRPDARHFPGCVRGASITGVRDASGKAVFYKDGRRIGTINDADFSRRFFAIWLGNNTSNPSLQASLTGSAR